jgi:hypothetical protein
MSNVPEFMAYAGWMGASLAGLFAGYFRTKANNWKGHAARVIKQRDETAALAVACTLMPGFSEGLLLGYLDALTTRFGTCTRATLDDTRTGVSLAVALDQAARVVATKYAGGELDFNAGDNVMNTLFAYASMRGEFRTSCLRYSKRSMLASSIQMQSAIRRLRIASPDP